MDAFGRHPLRDGDQWSVRITGQQTLVHRVADGRVSEAGVGAVGSGRGGLHARSLVDRAGPCIGVFPPSARGKSAAGPGATARRARSRSQLRECGAGAATVLVADDACAVGGVVDRPLLVAAPGQVAFVVRAAEDFDDPAALGRVSGQAEPTRRGLPHDRAGHDHRTRRSGRSPRRVIAGARLRPPRGYRRVSTEVTFGRRPSHADATTRARRRRQHHRSM